jgi:hypothetical protein
MVPRNESRFKRVCTDNLIDATLFYGSSVDGISAKPDNAQFPDEKIKAIAENRELSVEFRHIHVVRK